MSRKKKHSGGFKGRGKQGSSEDGTMAKGRILKIPRRQEWQRKTRTGRFVWGGCANKLSYPGGGDGPRATRNFRKEDGGAFIMREKKSVRRPSGPKQQVKKMYACWIQNNGGGN